MSNTVEIVTKLRDEMTAALNTQKQAFDQWSQKATGAGQAAAQTSTQTSALGRAMNSLAGQFTLGSLAANAVMGAVQGVQQAVRKLLSDAVRLTVEMADLSDAMGFLYGDSAAGVTAELDRMSEATGYTRSALYAMTRDIGATTSEFAATRAEAAAMGVDITQASADAAAALGLELGEASAALLGAMRGMSRSARQLGIDISQEAVAAELLRMGITESADAVDEATLTQARYNIVMAATSRFAGAAAEEMNTLEGAQRRANAAYEEMALQIGDAAAPMLERLTNAGSNLLPILGDILTAIVTLVDVAISPVAQAVADVAGIFDLFRDATAALSEKVAEQLPFLDDLKGIYDSLPNSLADITDPLRELLGLQDTETATLSTQTAGYRTYVSALSNATEAEVRYALAMIERMNIMGSLDPMVSAARERLEALRVEAEAAADAELAAYTAAFQAKKDAGLDSGGGGFGGGGGAEALDAEAEILATKKDMWITAAQEAADAEAAIAERVADKRIAEETRVKQERLRAEDEVAREREASIQRGIDQTVAFGMGMIHAGLQGQEAWDQFWDNFAMRLFDMVFSEAFGMLLSVLTGGGGGFFGDLFGALFAAGGDVQHAEGGMVVQGVHRGDRVPALLEPGERVLSRGEVREMQYGRGSGGGSVNNVTVTLGSMFGNYSRSDLQRAARVLKEVMDAGGIS